jgi:dCMP deaminase
MKEKFVDAYMDVADRFSKLSSAKRLQVGAIVVKDDRIISIGYNGMPSGWDNNCEDEIRYPDTEGVTLKTKPEVLHAESNAIAKLARSSESGDGATLFVTHQPCMECAKLIYQSGIKAVYYAHPYRLNDGLDFLQKSKINVTKVEKGS